MQPDELSLRDEIAAALLLREGGDDHFYGAWNGGPRSQGGGPVLPGDTKGQKQGTMAVYSPDHGKTWDPKRVKEVQTPFWDKAMAGVPTVAEPTVYMTGGGPASGKSKGLLPAEGQTGANPFTGIPSPTKAATFDPDSAKAATPEYKAAIAAKNKAAASNVHEESSYMALQGSLASVVNGHDTVYDTVGDSGAKLATKVADMRAHGAKQVFADYATVPIATAYARADERAKRTGRVVDHDVMATMYGNVSRTFQLAGQMNTFDRLRLWDTSGKLPRLIAQGNGKGGFVIKDQKAWDTFVRVGLP